MKSLFHMLSKTDDGAFVIDGRHRIIFWNPAAEAILGYTDDEVAGLQCYEILGGRDEDGRTLCQRYCQIVIRAQSGEVMPNKDVYTRTRSGNGRWLNVTTLTYHSGDKAIGPVIVHLFRDATERKNHQKFVNQVMSASERLRQEEADPLVSGTGPAQSPNSDLTDREWQVLKLLAQGLDTAEIAGSLTISPSTVRNHVQNILGKLGVHSRLEAIAYVYQRGLIENEANDL